DEEIEAPLITAMADADADVTLMIGDNVYGDIDKDRFTGADFDLNLAELAESYADLAQLPDFKALMAARPMLATWDDHDYGVNDAGGDMPAKELAERMFERFWGMEDADVAERPGVYYSRIAGPEGRRLQIIMLDTRFFRTALTHTDERGAKGKERYLPSQDPDQDMLGEAQWAWLSSELEKPADLRLIVSSIQITPDVHGWEAWSTLPKSRDKLYDLIRTHEIENAVFVTGDRHTAFLYRNTAVFDTPILEITASSLNKSFSKTAESNEVDAQQVGLGYAFENYGVIDIDWEERNVALTIIGEDAAPVSSVSGAF
ncbi:MAG: alkaline phosphatase D family protein, partial [Pseudomonadota bacterium]